MYKNAHMPATIKKTQPADAIFFAFAIDIANVSKHQAIASFNAAAPIYTQSDMQRKIDRKIDRQKDRQKGRTIDDSFYKL